MRRNRYERKMASKKHDRQRHMYGWSRESAGMTWEQFRAINKDNPNALHYWYGGYWGKNSTWRKYMSVYRSRVIRRKLKASLIRDMEDCETTTGRAFRKYFDYAWTID